MCDPETWSMPRICWRSSIVRRPSVWLVRCVAPNTAAATSSAKLSERKTLEWSGPSRVTLTAAVMGDDGGLIQMEGVIVAWDGKSGTFSRYEQSGGRVRGMRPKPQTV